MTEDLYGNGKNGFLHSTPNEINDKYPELQILLKQCFRCDEEEYASLCSDRFSVAKEILDLFNTILSHHKSLSK